ncbi:MAG: metallophosphoesterase [Candidatus Diapherotrites archaeon]
MDTKKILKFCLEKGLLLDRDALNLFSETSDTESVKLIIEKIRTSTKQNIITKNIFYENKGEINKFFSDLPKEKQEGLESLKINLGLSIEISREKSIASEEKKGIYGQKEINGVKVIYSPPSAGHKIGVQDFVKHFRSRFIEIKEILQNHPELNNLISINKIFGNRQGISILGMVSDKRVTKNKNILFEVEDFTGKIKVLINKDKKEVYEKAEEICLDSVIGFRGSGNGEIFFVNDIIFPDAGLPEKKKSPDEEYAVFIGDLHFGSKRFFKQSFLKFIDYLNGEFQDTPEVRKIKYLFLVGDIVTGIGNYPNQEEDLEIHDLEEQFSSLASLLGKIRKDIQIIISPGNHDGVRLMEPQPLFDEKYAWSIYDLENVILTSNPCLVNIGAKRNFGGFNVLTYHGFSFQYYANSIQKLIQKRAMNSPEEIMKYLLKNRHLAPSHASTQYFPLEEDALLIKEVPDIFVSAHTHKSGISNYNNILVISVSCWESMSPYQEKFGNKPDHCKVPLLNLKTRAIKILDFEDVEKVEINKPVEIEVNGVGTKLK